jgi:hypothetical protein
MGILSDFFIHSKDATPEFDPSKDWGSHRCAYKGITPLEAAAMLKAIRQSSDDRVSMMNEFKLLTLEDAEEWIMSVPDDMVKSLASANESKINDWATECTEMTKEELNWKASDFVEVITGLSKLSKTAIAENMNMYLWKSL